MIMNRWSTYEADGDTCGADTDDAYWYMGFTECFRANAAYSLYGVLKGKKDTGCTSSNFIQSLFTTTGVEAFTRSVAATGKVSFSNSNANGEDGEDVPGGISSTCYQNSNNKNRDLEESIQHNTRYNSGATSYGLACNGKKFAMKTFKSAFCDADSSQKTNDHLSIFNTEIQHAKCIQIYSSKYSGNTNYDDDNDPLHLLSTSQTCSIRDYPGLCPDPYLKLSHYAAAEERAYARTYNKRQTRTIRAFAILFMTLGCLLLVLSLLVYIRRSRLSRLRNLRRRFRAKSRAKVADERDGRRRKGQSERKSGFLRRGYDP